MKKAKLFRFFATVFASFAFSGFSPKFFFGRRSLTFHFRNSSEARCFSFLLCYVVGSRRAASIISLRYAFFWGTYRTSRREPCYGKPHTVVFARLRVVDIASARVYCGKWAASRRTPGATSYRGTPLRQGESQGERQGERQGESQSQSSSARSSTCLVRLLELPHGVVRRNCVH